MREIGVKNFRSIKDSGKINLKPITVIVGRNSSGKSSFVRLFPLLKQTVEKRISDPILWYGDYVDFGDFEHVITKTNKNHGIELFLSFSAKGRHGFYRGTEQGSYPVNITLLIRNEYFEKVTIEIYDQIIEIVFQKNKDISCIIINGDSNIFDCSTLRWFREEREFLPTIIELSKADNSYYGRFDYNQLASITTKLILGDKYKVDDSIIFDDTVFREIDIGSKKAVLNSLKRFAASKQIDKYIKMKSTDKAFINLNNYIVASSLRSILDTINFTIMNDLRNTNYIKPIRAMVDRYYRVQGINIDELDSDGSNLPMILYNMSKPDLKKFESWSEETFGVVFSVDSSQGHVSLIIKDTNINENTNLADTGYGYSQMLPIVVLLWMIHNKYCKKSPFNFLRTIVIEQPELHLHPAYQAKMIDVFVNIIKEATNQNIDIKIIFETHSEAMINRLGKLINIGKLDPSFVNVLIFDKVNEETKVISKNFNEKGLLNGWPIGFFAPDEVI